MENEALEHLDPTSEISLETVKQRSTKGVITLTGRYIVLYGITLVAQLFLAAFLTREQFGIFGVVSAFVNFLVYFSDIGLAASLIQKREAITDNDLKTTFTVQQILVLLLLSLVFLFSGTIKQNYHLSNDAIILLYALGFSFLLSSLKTIPSVILERNLRFEKLAIANILENIVYNVILVFLAFRGFGVTSFTIAVLARGVIGLISIYLFQPWTPGIRISIDSLRKLLKFGIPYQLNTFLAVLKDDGLTLVLGKIIGLDGIGILIWAQKWAQMPLRIVMDTVTKVTFPAFARMQDEKDHLAQSTTRSLFFICFLTFPAIVGLVLLAPLLVGIIPRYEKWTVALIPLAFVSVNTLFASFTTQLTNLLNAIGKIKVTFYLMIMWTVLTWVFVPALSVKFGVNGSALGYAVVGSSSVIAVFVAKKYVDFSLTDSVFKPFYATLGMGMTLFILRNFLPLNLSSVGILTVTGIIVYFMLMIFLIGKSLIDDAKRSLKTILS
ncbi:oligosaccharide flippase family protein [Candidatus Woesebacteria bacterium]|nr:oligosaccharide flippase family protein [Candidatus Woesebacteria bacterium]